MVGGNNTKLVRGQQGHLFALEIKSYKERIRELALTKTNLIQNVVEQDTCAIIPSPYGSAKSSDATIGCDASANTRKSPDSQQLSGKYLALAVMHRGGLDISTLAQGQRRKIGVRV
ncbi:uncharacterized protein [Euwallacea fornicatus]|uniref:uncharacterized protein n=1 Tax=Euwallacea fornicatus TaxID=995702 RepID=UPI00338F9D29